MKSSYIIPGLLALVVANNEPVDVPPPPAYPPIAPSSLPEASDDMHASSSYSCTLTTTLTITLTRTIPVVSVTPSHAAGETDIPEPSSYSLVPPLSPQLPQPLSPPYSDAPSSARIEERPAPTTIPTATTPLPVEETSAASSALAESSLSAAPAAPTSQRSGVVGSDGSNTHTSHVSVQSASSKPVGGSATTLTKTASFSGTGTATGTESYVPSSTPPFADAADVISVPGVALGVLGWVALIL